MPEIGQTYRARDRRAWRAWLQKNHERKREIWLLFYKKHVGKRCVPYDDAVEEALCFGWIDGILKRVDDEQHVVRFSPRRPRSVWSESNKKRVRAMIRAGKMTEAGMELVRAAKRSGAWQRAGQRSKPLVVPDDLRDALVRNQRAQRNFDGFAPGYQRDYVHWIDSAKRAETRQRRIREVVKRAAQNKKPGMM